MNPTEWRGWLEREWRDVVSAWRAPVREPGKPDEGALIEKATAGADALTWLENPQVQAFYAQAEANMVDALVNLPLENDAGRRDLAVAVKTIRKLRQYMGALAADGKQASRELERMASGKREFF